MAVAELRPGDELCPDGAGAFRYRITETLGSGGFGITYAAEDLRLGGEVVVKELACSTVAYRDTVTGELRAASGQSTTHRKLVRRFVREAQLLNRLRHPHIVRVTDVWEERGTAYYAMDKVDSVGTLRDPDAAGVTTRSWSVAKQHAEQLLDALDAVHEAGLVHGDVKPGNVLLDKKRGVVLIDFGTARADEEFGRTVTSTSFTRGYAPPELMHPSRVREAGPWSDIYSWGMVVWGLALPHPGDGGRPVDAASRRMDVDPYSDAAGQLEAAGLPPAWAATLGRCISLQPHERPINVAAVRAQLGGAPPDGTAVLPQVAPRAAGPVRSTQTLPPEPRPPHDATGEASAASAPAAAPTTESEPAGMTDAPAQHAQLGAAGDDTGPTGPSTLGPSGAASRASATDSATDTAPTGARRGLNTRLLAVGAALTLGGAGLAVAAALGVLTPAPPPPAAPGSGEPAPLVAAEGSADETNVVDDADGPPTSDACGGCADGTVCMDTACVLTGDGALARYAAHIDAWNSETPKPYFAAFADPLDCYHGRTQVWAADVARESATHFSLGDGSHFETDDVRVIEATRTSVLLEDGGAFVVASGVEKPRRVRVLFEPTPDGAWRITHVSSPTVRGCGLALFTGSANGR